MIATPSPIAREANASSGTFSIDTKSPVAKAFKLGDLSVLETNSSF